MKLKILVILIFCIIPGLSFASRNIGSHSLPWSENFDVNNYSDLYRNSGNGIIEHDSSGGWNGTGAVKITPGTVSHQYYCLGQITNIGGGNEKVVHVRWLQYFGPTYPTDQPAYKNLILIDATRASGDASDRPMSIANIFQNGMLFSVTDDTTRVNYDNVDYTGGPGAVYPDGDEFYVNDYLNQWVCFEYVADIANNRNRLYITTQDGRFSGLYSSTVNSIAPDRYIVAIDVLGLYVNTAQSGAHSSTTYTKIDELVISDSFIGPPARFLDGGETTTDTTPTDTITSKQNNGLPWSASFESGDWSEWSSGTPHGQSIISSTDCRSGSYCSRSPLTAGTNSDNYIDFYFGNFPTISDGDSVTGVEATYWTKFDRGYDWSSGTKTAIFNICDSTGSRRYQVYVYVKQNGEYAVTNSWIDSWQFLPNDQNIGQPVTVKFGEWEKMRLQVQLNTPGQSDGIIKLWINDELKISYNDRDIRQGTNYTLNKFILSSYTGTNSATSGALWHDDFWLREWSPRFLEAPLNVR